MAYIVNERTEQHLCRSVTLAQQEPKVASRYGYNCAPCDVGEKDSKMTFEVA